MLSRSDIYVPSVLMGTDMKHSDAIRSVVARFFNVAESEVTESYVFPSRRLEGSLARTTLHSALKRMAGVDLPAAYSANTYGQLIEHIAETRILKVPDAIDVKRSPSALIPVLRDLTPSRELGVGIDIEFVDNLPWTGDPWTDTFYLENFTVREIAYCIRQTNPKLSLCGLWSAKEAVIKCNHGGVRLRPKDLEIRHDVDGQPFVQRASEQHDFAILDGYHLSISHSNMIAVAVSVRAAVANGSSVKGGGQKPPLPEVSQQTKPPLSSSWSLQRLVWISLLLSVSAILLFLYFLATSM